MLVSASYTKHLGPNTSKFSLSSRRSSALFKIPEMILRDLMHRSGEYLRLVESSFISNQFLLGTNSINSSDVRPVITGTFEKFPLANNAIGSAVKKRSCPKSGSITGIDKRPLQFWRSEKGTLIMSSGAF